MSTKATDVPSATDDLVERLQSSQIQVPAPAVVRVYLSRYPELSDLVERAALSARRRFGEQAQLSLELYRDPEIKDEYLTLYVRMADYPHDVMEAIRDIRGEFGQDLAGMQGWFHVGTDFRPPRE